MCWDYVVCSACNSSIICSVSCSCTKRKACYEAGHRDCKNFEQCETCHKSICEYCWFLNRYCDEECGGWKYVPDYIWEEVNGPVEVNRYLYLDSDSGEDSDCDTQ